MGKMEGESKTAETRTGQILSLEMVINFQRKTPENIQGFDIEMVAKYKYLGVHLNWTGLD